MSIQEDAERNAVEANKSLEVDERISIRPVQMSTTLLKAYYKH